MGRVRSISWAPIVTAHRYSAVRFLKEFNTGLICVAFLIYFIISFITKKGGDPNRTAGLNKRATVGGIGLE